MSQENVEIVRRVIEAWNRNEQERVIPLERVVPFLDPGVIFDATRRMINPKTYAGIEGIRAMLAERDEVWESSEWSRMSSSTPVIESWRSVVGSAKEGAAGSKSTSP